MLLVWGLSVSDRDLAGSVRAAPVFGPVRRRRRKLAEGVFRVVGWRVADHSFRRTRARFRVVGDAVDVAVRHVACMVGGSLRDAAGCRVGVCVGDVGNGCGCVAGARGVGVDVSDDGRESGFKICGVSGISFISFFCDFT